MQDGPAVLGADTQARADLAGLEAQPLTHHEDAACLTRQAADTALEHGHHLSLLGSIVGLLPGWNLLDVGTVGAVERVDGVVAGFVIAGTHGKSTTTALVAYLLDALELETLVWLPEEHLSALMDPSRDRWRGAE